MKTKHEKKVRAVLKYQEEKRKLVKDVTGIDIIPDKVALKAEDIGVKEMNLIESDFGAYGTLICYNCIHCLLYPGCVDCPYVTAGIPCQRPTSTFIKASNAWEKSTIPNHTDELYSIGLDLQAVLERPY